MKIHLYLFVLAFITLSNKLNAQCPPPWFPPIGDSCPTATPFCDDINGYCGTLSFVNIPQPFPACPSNVLNNDDWFAFVAGSNSLTLNIKPSNCLGLNGQIGMQAAIYEEGCNGIPVAIQCDCTDQPFVLSAPTIPGVSYYLVLDGCAGDICDYEIEVEDGNTFPIPPTSYLPDGPNVVCSGQQATYSIPLQASGTSYQWSVNPPTAGVFVSAPFGTNVLFESSQAGPADICVQRFNVCGLASTIECLAINIEPITQTTTTLQVCYGDCIDTLSTTMCSPGNYEVTLTSSSGCDSIVYFNIFPLPPTFEFLGEFELPCDGSLEIDGQVFTELGNQEYVLTNSQGCDSTVILTILPGDVIADAGPDKFLGCLGQPVELQGDVTPMDVTSFVWETSNGNFVSGQNTLNPIVDQVGTYCLVATNDTSGCVMINCVDVVVNTDEPLIDFPQFTVPCDGSPLVICAEVDAMSGANYDWITSIGNIVNTDDECATINEPGEYCLTVTNPNGCDSTLCVNVFSDLSVLIDAPDSACPGSTEAVHFKVENNAAAATILYWQFGNGPISQDTLDAVNAVSLITDQLDFLQDITITAWAVDENGCTGDTVMATVLSDAYNVSFTVTQDACGAATVEAIYPGNAISFTWNDGTQGPVLLVNEDGIYEITIVDAGGCEVVRSIFVELDFMGSCAYLEGAVNQDLMGNCNPLANMPALSGWTVIASGVNGDYFATTAPDGTYFMPVEPGVYTVSIFTPSSVWEVCQNDIAVTLPNIGDMQTVDFLVKKSADCPIMQVDISSSLLRICQDNLFAVKYCNIGTVPATNAYIDINLDDLLIFQNATIVFQDLGNNMIRFQVGDVDANDCGDFLFRTQVDCNAPLGFVHCTEAHIYPDTSCVEPDPQWSGASLEVIGECEGETRFTVTNVGDGSMASPLTYRIYRNTSIYLSNQEAPLGEGESFVINLPADGAAWRMEVDQDPFYPFAPVGVSTVQGCTSMGVVNIANSLVNDMYLADQDNFLDEDCRPNVGSFDPNLKMGSPEGLDVDRFIPDGTAIEYFIQFQNTGMDTAFSVVVRDTLSDLLDISTIQMGASSHPHTYQLLGNGILKIDFPNIKLPHVDVDEIGSIGFIEFKITAKDGLAPFTRIENDASIYFDYNEPVKTNTTFHTIEKPVVHSFQEVDICQGDSWNGVPQFQDNTVSETFSFVAYDSMAWTEIHVIPPFDSTVVEYVCHGEMLIFNGETYGPGTYQQMVSPVDGCDTNFTIIVNVLPIKMGSLMAEVCSGGTYEYLGQQYESPGQYEFTFEGTNGCDSIFMLLLTDTDTLTEEINVDLCQGSVYEFNGEMLDSSGHFETVFQTAGGCDSLVTLNLTVWATFENGRAATICYGDSAEYNGQVFYESGIYTETYSSVHGCDSTETLDLTVLDSIGSDFSQTICENEPFIFNGETLTEAGTYEAVFPSAEGCDSTVVLFLEVEPVFSDTIELAVEPGEIINGLPIYSDTSFIFYLVTQNGCDSTVVTNIDVILNGEENIASTINLSIFPNPTDERFYVKFNLPELQNVQVEILDVIGQKVVFASQKSTYPAGEHFMEINSEGWPSGVYLVHFQMDSGVATGRVVVK